MKKYTAAYSNVRDNFAIINIDENHKCSGAIYGLYCVAQNIILRGNPSIPSGYVQSEIGAFDEIGNKLIYLVNTETPEWTIIKGDDSGVYYPVEQFFYDLLTQFLTSML